MRSVVVVLLASMWAMMPMFRYFSSGVSRAIYGPEERLRFVFQARVFVDLLRMPALFTPTKTRVDRTPQLEGWYPSAAAGCTRFCYAVGTHWRAGLSPSPALSCEQPLIITQ